ncbi:uncharacterized protein [Physcomitrium patens]|uniref:uncharacterized protein isoform X2 n=1 Tax=Physcomitrium patens TaxID=3218 RepID=UPI003CCD6800
MSMGNAITPRSRCSKMGQCASHHSFIEALGLQKLHSNLQCRCFSRKSPGVGGKSEGLCGKRRRYRVPTRASFQSDVGMRIASSFDQARLALATRGDPSVPFGSGAAKLPSAKTRLAVRNPTSLDLGCAYFGMQRSASIVSETVAFGDRNCYKN